MNMVDTANWKEDKKYGGYMTPKYVREREGNKKHPNFCKHCGSTVVHSRWRVQEPLQKGIFQEDEVNKHV